MTTAKRIQEYPLTAFTETDDILYLARGTGGGPGTDHHIKIEDLVYPKYLSLTSTTPVDLGTYKGDLTIMASGTFTITFTNELLVGKQLVVMNKGTGVITCAGTVAASLKEDESLRGISDGSAMAVTRHISMDASGNLAAISVIGNITGTGALSINGAVKSGTTGANGSLEVGRTSDGASIGFLTTDGTHVHVSNTGAGGSLKLKTAGSDRLIIDDSGNVGIGVTPSTLLHVGKNQNGSTKVTTTNTNSGTSAYSGIEIEGENAVGFLRAHSDANTELGRGGTVVLGATGGTANGLILYAATERMRFQGVGGVTRMELNNNVLAFGVAPKAWDSNFVAMDIGSHGTVMSQNTGAATDGIYIIDNIYNDAVWKRKATKACGYYVTSAGVHKWFSDVSGSAGVGFTPTERMRLNVDGQLLIGTTVAPITAFRQVVFNAATSSLAIYQTTASGTGTGNGSYIGHHDTSGMKIWGYENLGMTFGTNDTERLTISAAGDLAINTNKFTVAYATGNLAINTDKFTVAGATGNTVVAGSLQVGGSIIGVINSAAYIEDIRNLSSDAAAHGLKVRTNNNNAATELLRLEAAAATRFTVFSDGGVSMPFIPTSGSGNAVYVTAAGTLWENTSSRRFKTNIRELELDTTKVLQLQATTYERKDKEGKAIKGSTEHGPIAEDSAKVDPCFATYDKDGKTPRGLHKDNILWALLEEVKKLRSEVNELKGA